MSLYGGISFGGQAAEPDVPKPAEQPSAPVAAAAAPAAAAAVADEKPKSATWSAALRFAPTIRKRPAPSAASAIPLAFKSAFSSAEDVVQSPTGPRIVGRAKAPLSLSSSLAAVAAAAAPTISAPPTTTTTTTTTAPAQEPVFATRPGRIMQAPSMTLDPEDVNGFRQSTAGGNKGKGKGKGKGKKNAAKKEDPALAFSGVAYDPARPCDYSAYKQHVQRTRAQRRSEREAELRRARSPSGSSYESSDGEGSDKDERSNKKARFFAPPTSYDSSAPAAPQPPPTVLEAPNLAAAPRGETGEEAYLRRIAMSAGGGRAAPPPPAPAFAPAFTPASHPPPLPSAGPQAFPSFSPASSMSAGPQAYPSFSPASGLQAHHPASAGPQAYPSFSPASTSSLPSSYPPPPPPPFISSSADHSPLYTPPLDFAPEDRPTAPDWGRGGPPAESNVPLSEAAAKAREIAQRLSKLAGLQPPTPPVAEPAAPAQPDYRPFADRMMSKFGWTEGKGLGADESGMTTALSVSRAKSAKRGKGKKDPDAPPAPVGMAAAAKGRATIVDQSRESRIASQTAQVGEPSRVVLLTNLCGLDDVDDDLGGEVAEEANKFGVVERCFVYLVPGETRDDEGVRIFLVMSGLAGGWNAVRQFDGRFFGGRVVKARFYDEATFNAGEHRV